MSGAPTLYPADTIGRRVLFVLRLMDPIAGVAAGARLRVEAKDWGQPQVTRAGELVWLAPRWKGPHQFAISVRSPDRAFVEFDKVIPVPHRPDGAPVFEQQLNLQPTGLYTPPAGRLAVGGMLVEKAPVPALPPAPPPPPIAIPSAKVRLIVIAEDGTELVGTLAARSDARGGFVAVASDFGDTKVALFAPVPGQVRPPEGAIQGLLEVTWRGTIKHSNKLALRSNAFTRIERPLAWDLAGLLPP